jgi:hypothetical protein
MMIRRIVLILMVASVLALVPRASSSAATFLALARSDYPHGAKIAVYPATNAETDHRFGQVHRSTFEALHRLDGVGWLQAAVWYFSTGKGAVKTRRNATFAYAMNAFKSAKAAKAAQQDLRLTWHATRVAHIRGRRSWNHDARVTLVYLSFTVKSVEVETYYEYASAAPNSVVLGLRHAFSKQSSHLVKVARKLDIALHSPAPTATPTVTPVPTATATSLPTATVTAVPTQVPPTRSVPTATLTPRPATSTPVPTAVPTHLPTTTPVPAGYQVQAAMMQPAYGPGETATLNVTVTLNGTPVQGARISANVLYPNHPAACSGVTGRDGSGTCTTLVPSGATDGQVVPVWIQIVTPDNQTLNPPQVSFQIEQSR